MVSTPTVDRPSSGDVSAPAYVTATTGAALWALSEGFRRAGLVMPPEVYVWVQLSVPLAMGWVTARWRARHKRRPLPE